MNDYFSGFMVNDIIVFKYEVFNVFGFLEMYIWFLVLFNVSFLLFIGFLYWFIYLYIFVVFIWRSIFFVFGVNIGVLMVFSLWFVVICNEGLGSGVWSVVGWVVLFWSLSFKFLMVVGVLLYVIFLEVVIEVISEMLVREFEGSISFWMGWIRIIEEVG